MPKSDRFHGLLDPLRFAPSIAKGVFDALGDLGEKFERADRPALGQKLLDPVGDPVLGIDVMAFDVASKVGHFVGAVAVWKNACGVIEIEVSRVRRPMLKTHDALEAKLFRAPRKLRYPDVIAE
jgi:hypothetical protein